MAKNQNRLVGAYNAMIKMCGRMYRGCRVEKATVPFSYIRISGLIRNPMLLLPRNPDTSLVVVFFLS